MAEQENKSQEETDLNKLIIYGAVYGKADVTLKCRSLINTDTHSLQTDASNKVFGDSWLNNKKSLVVIAGYGGKVATYIAEEGNSLSIFQDGFKGVAPSNNYGAMNILGGSYGLKDVTNQVQALYGTYTQSGVKVPVFVQGANNTAFGDGWPNVVKTLVTVFRLGPADPTNKYGGNVYVSITEENGTLTV
mmetsp:Transcript_2822/g.2377  ORF Transcript_2822/g.2377 Transcript_2822/m.2377 type:complete len:190 (+) Transcript_2822:2-571(+)